MQTSKKYWFLGISIAIIFFSVGIILLLNSLTNKESVVTSIIRSDWFPSLPFITEDPQSNLPPTSDNLNISADENSINPMELIFDGPVSDFNLTTLGDRNFIVLSDRNQNHLYWGELSPTKTSLIKLVNVTQTNQTEVYTWTDILNKKIFVLQTNQKNNQNLLFTITPDGSVATTSRQILTPISNIAQLKDNILLLNHDKRTTFGFKTNTHLEQTNDLLFRIPMSSLKIQSASSSVVIGTNPSALMTSYWYTLNSESGELNKILNGRGILTTISPNGDNLLYSNTTWGELYVYSIDKKTTKTLRVGTLATKCAWLDSVSIICGIPKTKPIGVSLPDDWYKGKLVTSDSLWVINTQTGETSKLLDEVDALNVDINKIKVSSDGLFIVFQNNKDYRVWSIRLIP